jgi:hypothetical protein
VFPWTVGGVLAVAAGPRIASTCRTNSIIQEISMRKVLWLLVLACILGACRTTGDAHERDSAQHESGHCH